MCVYMLQTLVKLTGLCLAKSHGLECSCASGLLWLCSMGSFCFSDHCSEGVVLIVQPISFLALSV